MALQFAVTVDHSVRASHHRLKALLFRNPMKIETTMPSRGDDRCQALQWHDGGERGHRRGDNRDGKQVVTQLPQ